MDQANSIDSKFRFAIIVAKRAKQLINGAKPLVEMDAQNPLTIAIEEVNQGLVTAELLDSVNLYLKEASLAPEEESEAEGEAAEGEEDVDITAQSEEVVAMNLLKEETKTPEGETQEEEKEVTEEEK